MRPEPIKFGTDGWRGVIAEDFTFANLRRVAQATADFWTAQSPAARSTIVGYDNRFLSEHYARAVCEVLVANGFSVLYPPAAAPTPAISHAVARQGLCGAVMITASHNPPRFNGYKLKADHAGPADPQLCAQVESWIDRSAPRASGFDEALKSGAVRIHDPRAAHLAALRLRVSLREIRRAGLRVVADAMHGCGGRSFESLLAGSACRVVSIRTQRDALFGGANPEPIACYLGPLRAAVKRARAHIGLATDGDADRIGLVDERGRYVSIQIVFALLLLHMARSGAPGGARRVVKSANCSYLVDRICAAHGLECVEVPVGFKHICERMRAGDVLIGGEESGGFGFHGHIPERDGILAGLMLLEMLARTGQSVSRLAEGLQREFGRSEYGRVDLAYPLTKRAALIERLVAEPPSKLPGAPLAEIKTLDGVKYVARDDSWLMFRVSGTEPIVRVYSEAPSRRRVQRLLGWGKSLALRIAG
jgi:phosphomannomutase